MVAASPTATSATSASVTEAGSRRRSSSSGTSRCSSLPGHIETARLEVGHRRLCPPPAVGDLVRFGPELLAHSGNEALIGQEGADVDALVEGPAEAVQPHVDPPQRLRLGHAHRGVRERLGEVEGVRVDPEQPSEAAPDVVLGRRRVEDQHMDPLGRHSLRPALKHQAEVERAPVPDHRGLLRDPAPIVGHRCGRAVLQALLPAGGEEPERFSCRDDHVHLGVAECGHHVAGLATGGGGEELVADQARR